VTQEFDSSSDTFDLTVTAQLLVPAEGDVGTLSVTLAVLDLHEEQQVGTKIEAPNQCKSRES